MKGEHNMQHEVTRSTVIPDAQGLLPSPGWARTELMAYTREHIHAPWFRRKEWDYYLFNTEEFAVAFTISDLGYVGLLSASFIDLKEGTEHTESELALLPRGKKFGLGICVSDAHGECRTKRLDMKFSNAGDHRHIHCVFRNFDGDKDLSAELDVFEPDMEAMYIATAWKEKPTAFYYNCKRNCLTAEGTVQYGSRTCTVQRSSCSGVLDWGRGVWTYDNIWFWGTGSGKLNGEDFGFNLGYGFSDRSSASENAVYYQGRIHKLSEVTFCIPEDENGRRFTDPWAVTSDDGRFTGSFAPILDRKACMNFGVIISDQHQVFGRMTGTAVLDSGETLSFKDFICALEVVRNKY